MTRVSTVLCCASLLLGVALAGCGKYGPPERRLPPPPGAVVEPEPAPDWPPAEELPSDEELLDGPDDAPAGEEEAP